MLCSGHKVYNISCIRLQCEVNKMAEDSTRKFPFKFPVYD